MPAADVQRIVVSIYLEQAIPMLAWQTESEFGHCCNGLTWCL